MFDRQRPRGRPSKYRAGVPAGRGDDGPRREIEPKRSSTTALIAFASTIAASAAYVAFQAAAIWG